MSFKKKWEQLQCLHYWVEGEPTRSEYGKGFEYAYDCSICQKHIKRWSGDRPVSGAMNPDYEQKDPRYNLSPPIIRRRD